MLIFWEEKLVGANFYAFCNYGCFPLLHTKYKVRLDQGWFAQTVYDMFFPLQWIHVCLSVAGKVTLVNLVIDNKLLQDEEYQKKYKVSNISLLFGRDPSKNKYTQVSELNIFNSSLPARV